MPKNIIKAFVCIKYIILLTFLSQPQIMVPCQQKNKQTLVLFIESNIDCKVDNFSAKKQGVSIC